MTYVRTAVLLLLLVFVGGPAAAWSAGHNWDGSARKYTDADGQVVYYTDPLGPNAPIPAPGSSADAFTAWAQSVCDHWMAEPDDYRKGAGCHIDAPNTTTAHAVYDPTQEEIDRIRQKAERDAQRFCDRIESEGYTCTEVAHD